MTGKASKTCATCLQEFSYQRNGGRYCWGTSMSRFTVHLDYGVI